MSWGSAIRCPGQCGPLGKTFLRVDHLSRDRPHTTHPGRPFLARGFHWSPPPSKQPLFRHLFWAIFLPHFWGCFLPYSVKSSSRGLFLPKTRFKRLEGICSRERRQNRFGGCPVRAAVNWSTGFRECGVYTVGGSSGFFPLFWAIFPHVLPPFVENPAVESSLPVTAACRITLRYPGSAAVPGCR